jgi:acyl-CoA reductase-like NAD-dependent aldehyde dehydrogenase
MEVHPMIIDGAPRRGSRAEDVINPATEQPFARVAVATAEDLEAAVAAADRAAEGWARDLDARRAAIWACAQAVESNIDDLARLLVTEHGRAMSFAKPELDSCVAWLRYYADHPLAEEELSSDPAKRVTLVRCPVGVTAAITPWNFPAGLLVWKLAPAFLAGCTVIAKPSPFAPLTALRLAELFNQHLPRGVFSMVCGGTDVGSVLVLHPRVAKVSFTGSVPTGKRIYAGAAGTMKRVHLELGGNDAGILLPDVDVDAVAPRIFWGANFCSGQICLAIKRLFVPASIHDRFVEAFVAYAKTVVVGDGMEPSTQVGPLNNAPLLERVRGLVEDARARGGRVVLGGERLPRPGYFYPPTLVTGCAPGMPLVEEEQFGTALPVIRYETVEEAIAMANDTRFGLAASVWTPDIAAADSIARRLEAGTVWINDIFDLDPATPFGGIKESGLGLENGQWGLDELTTFRVIRRAA